MEKSFDFCTFEMGLFCSVSLFLLPPLPLPEHEDREGQGGAGEVALGGPRPLGRPQSSSPRQRPARDDAVKDPQKMVPGKEGSKYELLLICYKRLI